MSSRKPPPVKEDISPNVVPMIDIMFLLLLFFMLGADMSQRESVEVVLPKADQIKTTDVEGKDPETTVNIHHDRNINCPVFDNGGVCREKGHWVISIRGNDYTYETLKPQLQIEADEFPEEELTNGKHLSKKKILIRAEQTAPYGDVQKVIETAGAVGMYKVEIAGMKALAAAPSR
jgi:biopolymer transport protein ExbD